MEERRRIGLIVNPLAGIGGRLGFKGSDGAYGIRALLMGAELVAPSRAKRFLEALRPGVEIVAPPGIMGADLVRETRHASMLRIVPCVPRKTWPTTAADTRRCAASIESERVDLLVFVGGDGTARDIYNAVGVRLPVLGVPSGVKVYSSVFAKDPVAAARIVEEFLNGERILEEREVVDIDEDAFRRGELKLRIYGHMLVPASRLLVPSSKSPSHDTGDMQAIADYVVDEIARPCTMLILGPGTTTAAIARALGVSKTLLGVDVVHNRSLIAKDVNEEALARLIREHIDNSGRVLIIVSPIGGQGYILGRGNQQISPSIVKMVGPDNVVVVATPGKLAGLDALRVDTGDDEVDSYFRGRYIKVLTGYGRFKAVKIE